MSQESPPGSVGIGIAPVQRAEPASELTEFDLGYYGWRVVLAACLGVMAGFGSLFVYTFSVFVKPLAAEFGWSREAISSGFAIAAVTLGVISPLLGRWIDRFGPRRIILVCMTIYVCAIASLSLLRSGIVAVLRDLLRTGCSWKRCSSSGLFAIDFHLVSATPRNGVGLRDGGSGFWCHDFTCRRSIHHQPVWLASSVRVTRRSCIVTRLASQLALHPRARGDRAGVRSSRSFWNDMAAGPSLFCLLDHHCHPFREFDQHERGDHSPFRVADGSRPHHQKCSAMRVHTRWIEPAWQDHGGMAARLIFRATGCPCNKPHYRARHFTPCSGKQFPGGLPCGCAHRHRGRRRSRHYTLPANALFWATRFFYSLRRHLDVLCRCWSHRAGDIGARV